MPKVIWLAQENRTAEQQQAAEWRIAKKHLTGKPPGTQELNLIQNLESVSVATSVGILHTNRCKIAEQTRDYKPSAVRVTQRYVP
ncbi:hypothetical protein AWJ11_02905 [Piscirickettsia salmonis]|uniref:hypothetical protein n=1 Tax=Piscirickettsia salmonis TaxID=1238 RepID=UPI000745BD55|nr:hypothetical protein [Piscirickettsia salmonis]AMA41457.1 hypothetical protein AWJ11_02905 [Piscirickettsia salmonis]